MTKAKGIPLASSKGWRGSKFSRTLGNPQASTAWETRRFYPLVPWVVPLRRELTYIGISREGCFKYKPYVLKVQAAPLFTAARPLIVASLLMKGRRFEDVDSFDVEAQWWWWNVLKNSCNYFLSLLFIISWRHISFSILKKNFLLDKT